MIMTYQTLTLSVSIEVYVEHQGNRNQSERLMVSCQLTTCGGKIVIHFTLPGNNPLPREVRTGTQVETGRRELKKKPWRKAAS